MAAASVALINFHQGVNVPLPSEHRFPPAPTSLCPELIQNNNVWHEEEQIPLCFWFCISKGRKNSAVGHVSVSWDFIGCTSHQQLGLLWARATNTSYVNVPVCQYRISHNGRRHRCSLCISLLFPSFKGIWLAGWRGRRTDHKNIFPPLHCDQYA